MLPLGDNSIHKRQLNTFPVSTQISSIAFSIYCLNAQGKRIVDGHSLHQNKVIMAPVVIIIISMGSDHNNNKWTTKEQLRRLEELGKLCRRALTGHSNGGSGNWRECGGASKGEGGHWPTDEPRKSFHAAQHFSAQMGFYNVSIYVQSYKLDLRTYETWSRSHWPYEIQTGRCLGGMRDDNNNNTLMFPYTECNCLHFLFRSYVITVPQVFIRAYCQGAVRRELAKCA